MRSEEALVWATPRDEGKSGLFAFKDSGIGLRGEQSLSYRFRTGHREDVTSFPWIV